MKTTDRNYTEENNRSMRTGIIVLGVLLLIALVLMFLFLFRSGRVNREAASLREDRRVLLDENLRVEEQRDQTRQEMEALRSEMEQMQTDFDAQLQTRDSQIAGLRARSQDLAALRDRIEEYQHMEQEYENLRKQYARLQQDYQELEGRAEMLTGEQQQLRSLINEARPLRVSSIYTLNRWDRWLWADRYNVNRARRIDHTYINFEVLGSPFTTEGNRTIHVNMVDPEGNVMYTPEDQNYTAMEEIEFVGDPVPLEFQIDHPDRLEAGIYQIEVYINGELARSKRLEFN